MAEREPSGGEGSEPDLRARIESRVAERRASRAAAPAPGSAAPGSAEPGLATPGSAEQEPAADRPAVAHDTGAPAAEARPAGQAAKAGPGQPGQPPSRANRLIRTLGFLLAVVVTVVVLRSFVVASYYIPSGSMEPTLHGCLHCQPDLVVVDKLSYRFSSVARSDVVVFNRPPLAPPEDAQLIKRVIGLPGETISGHDGKVFVGAKALPEPYVNPGCAGTGSFPAIKVPAGEYFVMGDNRCDSLDSRVFGVIPGSSIVGRSVAVTWPVKHLRWL